MRDEPKEYDPAEYREALPYYELLRAFSNAETRFAVYYLVSERTATVDELADVVTGWMNAESGGIATATDRENVAISLYHVSLPTLDSLDVVEFDPDERTVSMEESSSVMESFVEWVRGLDRESVGDVSS